MVLLNILTFFQSTKFCFVERSSLKTCFLRIVLCNKLFQTTFFSVNFNYLPRHDYRIVSFGSDREKKTIDFTETD